jgi:hypothetical protein
MAIDTIKSTAVLDGAISTADLANDIAINTSGAITTTGAFTSKGIDDNADAVALTIDSSENVLIGTTDDQPPTNSDVSGIALRADGKIAASRASGIAGDFNNNAEGNIVWFRKNGTVVATVSTRTGGGDAPYFGGYTNADTGIAFSSARMYPVNSSGVVANGTRDLGNTDARWGNLWLSGGVHLGGTGSANKLEDYEEGAWSPTLSAAGYTFQYNATTEGRYVKIGRLVHINGYIRLSHVPSGSGTPALNITGIPFSTSNVNSSSYTAGAMIVEGSGSVFSGIPTLRPNRNSTTVYIMQNRPGQSPLFGSVPVANLTSSMEFEFQISYQTDA